MLEIWANVDRAMRKSVSATVAPVKLAPVPYGVHEAAASEIGIAEIGPVQIAFRQRRVREIGAAQVDVPHIGGLQYGFRQVLIGEIFQPCRLTALPCLPLSVMPWRSRAW